MQRINDVPIIYQTAIDLLMIVMFVQLYVTLLYYLNPKTSLAWQTMASPSTDMLICEDFFYLKLLLLLHTQHWSTQKSIRQDYSHKTNLTSSPEFDGRVGELGDKAS